MNEELVAQFVEHVKAEHGGGGVCGAGTDAEGMLQLELAVQESLMRLGRAAVRRLVNEVGAGHQGSEVNDNGQTYRFKGYRPRTVHGLYGTVTIRRAYYATGSGAGLAPLDEQLGIGGGQTPACAYFRRVWVEMNRRSSDLSKLCLVFIGDGADWICRVWRSWTTTPVAASLISVMPPVTSPMCASSLMARVPSAAGSASRAGAPTSATAALASFSPRWSRSAMLPSAAPSATPSRHRSTTSKRTGSA